VHTNPGCTLASASANSLAISGSVIGGVDCSALDTGNQGCGIRASSADSFGSGFNAIGGGVYASELQNHAILLFSDDYNSEVGHLGRCDLFLSPWINT